ncbi:hypothetical protein KKG31_03475 [Patescibacteria group bacterium]|nr:hypothetical protein [Patescibacteria group bacterium]MBU1758208.1 hypothetical protein [Patescibacteria group bacterium]
MGKKTAMDIIKSINNEKFIVKNLKDLVVVMTNAEFLREIYGVGEKMVEEILKFFDSKENKILLQRLEKSGLNFDSQKYME